MSELDRYKNMKPVEQKPVEKKPEFIQDLAQTIRERQKDQEKQMQPEPIMSENPTLRSVPPPETKKDDEAKHVPLSERINPEQKKNNEAEPDAVFSKKDRMLYSRKKLTQMKTEGKRMRRGEKKDIENLEFDRTSKTRVMYIALAVIGIMFVGFVRQYLPNQAMYSIILIMGMMLFFPCGVIAGWLLLDPFMRCKILRRMSKRNYGIVGFVGKGMKAVLKIKNFDDGLIWRDKACWVITKDKLVQVTKEGNALTNKERVIDPECVITLVDTIPMIFVDLDSMEPLMLHQKGREAVYPLEIGATLKAWEDNQRAKIMALKKAQDILLYIAIICAAGAIVVGFLNLQKIEAMGKEITLVHGMLSNMSQIH